MNLTLFRHKSKLITADEYSKYMIETPILEGVANREYYGRSATSIENKSTIKYDTEQGVMTINQFFEDFISS